MSWLFLMTLLVFANAQDSSTVPAPEATVSTGAPATTDMYGGTDSFGNPIDSAGPDSTGSTGAPATTDMYGGTDSFGNPIDSAGPDSTGSTGAPATTDMYGSTFPDTTTFASNTSKYAGKIFDIYVM